MAKSITIDMGNDNPITIETGKMALLANGAVTVRQGDTIILVTACSGGVREGMDFFPLQVSYREKYSANGTYPGGFIKREARPSEKEVLIGRMTDRPIRPLFPKGFYNEVQIQCLLLSFDGVNDPDVLAMLGSSAALTLSDLPFNGPTGSVRVGRVNGELVVNPTIEQMKESDLELIYSGIEDKVIMIEGDSSELVEAELYEALKFANEKVKIQVAALRAFGEENGKEIIERELGVVAEDAKAAMKAAIVQADLDAACLVLDRASRDAALKDVCAAAFEIASANFDEDRHGELKSAFGKLTEANIRRQIIEEGKRSDGRGTTDLRPLTSEVGVLPCTHGTGLFARGETQALVVATLGTADDEQKYDSATQGSFTKKFYLQYNFPNFSVGECGRIMGPGNREIGHGNLAERSIAKMMPADFPYTVRCVSEVMGSNGSTSMASICGASLALFDAGVPLGKQIAGISCGLVQEGDDYVMITDILGSEDHYGDMDFKVAGTRDGITGFQLDLKLAGISLPQMEEALGRNLTARLAILDSMDACIDGPREELNENAPQIKEIKIKEDKIGALIGTGGKTIKNIVEVSGAKVNIEDDGTVKIFASDKTAMTKALEMIESEVSEVEIGKIYRGEVTGVKPFGAFVQVFGQSGLLHISEMDEDRVEKVEDICEVGDKVTVKVLDVDNRGRVTFSRKAALQELED